MCVCVCVCLNICVCVCVSIYLYICILCVYIYIFIYIYTHTHTHTYIYICVCVCIFPSKLTLVSMWGGYKMLWLERTAPRTDVNEGGRELLRKPPMHQLMLVLGPLVQHRCMSNPGSVAGAPCLALHAGKRQRVQMFQHGGRLSVACRCLCVKNNTTTTKRKREKQSNHSIIPHQPTLIFRCILFVCRRQFFFVWNGPSLAKLCTVLCVWCVKNVVWCYNKQHKN